MKTSVVLSVYNGSDYLTQQLDSIRTQSLTPDEVIIADDCSSDNSFDVINEYIDKYQLFNWKLYKNDNNYGWKKSFMLTCSKATGDIIYLCDQDDIWDIDKVRVMTCIMRLHREVQVLVSDYFEFTKDLSREDFNKPSKNQTLKTIKHRFSFDFFKVKKPGCSYCLRKSFFNEIKGYWKESYPHDALFWRFAISSNGLYECKEKLLYWRKHNSSTFSLESINTKSFSGKIEWMDYATSFAHDLELYLTTKNMNDVDKKIDIIRNFEKWLSIRKRFYERKRLIDGIYLLGYRKYYNSQKQLLGDYYLVLREKIKKKKIYV